MGGGFGNARAGRWRAVGVMGGTRGAVFGVGARCGMAARGWAAARVGVVAVRILTITGAGAAIRALAVGVLFIPGFGRLGGDDFGCGENGDLLLDQPLDAAEQ